MLFRSRKAASPQPAIAPQTRVRHEDFGDGTVLQADGDYLLVQFDGHICAYPGMHVEEIAFLPSSHNATAA